MNVLTLTWCYRKVVEMRRWRSLWRNQVIGEVAFERCLVPDVSQPLFLFFSIVAAMQLAASLYSSAVFLAKSLNTAGLPTRD